MQCKTNQIYLKQVKFHTLPKTLITKILYMWLQFLGGFVCFHLTVQSKAPLNVEDLKPKGLSASYARIPFHNCWSSLTKGYK